MYVFIYLVDIFFQPPSYQKAFGMQWWYIFCFIPPWSLRYFSYVAIRSFRMKKYDGYEHIREMYQVMSNAEIFIFVLRIVEAYGSILWKGGWAVAGKDRAKSNVKWKKRLHYWLMKGGHAECSPRGISVASQITFVLWSFHDWFIIEINGKVYCWFMHELHSHLIGNGLKLSNEKNGIYLITFRWKIELRLGFFPSYSA